MGVRPQRSPLSRIIIDFLGGTRKPPPEAYPAYGIGQLEPNAARDKHGKISPQALVHKIFTHAIK